MSNDQRTQAAAWHSRSDELAQWTLCRLVNRMDVWGAYGGDGTWTAPAKNNRGVKTLTLEIVRQHFQATSRSQVIGLHSGSPGPESTALWCAADIDSHTDDDNPEANLETALRWHNRAIEYGLTPMLTDSNGKGGYHLRILFSGPIPLHVMHWFARWLFRNEDGAETKHEVFPKQEKLTASGDGSCGNWLRLPGRHHKHDHWTRVWNGERWLSSNAAVEYILSTKGDDPSRAIELHAEAMRETEAEKATYKEAITKAGCLDAERHRLYGLASLRRACERIIAAPDNCKHAALRDQSFSIGHLHPNYLCDLDECQQALEDAIRPRAEDFNKAQATIRSGLKLGSKDPKPPLPPLPKVAFGNGNHSNRDTEKKPTAPPPPYRPFPVHCLPMPLAAYVAEAAAAIGCDPAFVALPCLAVVASLIGNTRSIRLKQGWFEPSILWAAIVGESGTHKSPALAAAVDPIEAIEKRFAKQFAAEHADFRQEFQEWKDADKNERGDEPKPPIQRRAVIKNATIEAGANVLSNNPRGVLLALDELATWLGSFTKYKVKAGGTDMQHWLEAHGGRAWIIDRKTGIPPTIFIPHVAVSVTGGIQPAILASQMTGEHWSSGFGARLLLAWPPRCAKVWTEAVIDPDTAAAYSSLLESLLSLQFREHDGDSGPHQLTLSADAKTEWVKFYDAWGSKQANAEGNAAAAFSKLEGYAARLALIHHVVEKCYRGEDDLTPVQAASVRAGVELVQWFAAEAERIYSLLSESEEQGNSRRLAEMIRLRGGHITTRELQRSNPAKYVTAETAEAALEDLVAADFGSWRVDEAGQKGGRPVRRFILHPTPDKTDITLSESDEGFQQAPDTTSQPEIKIPIFPTNHEVLSVVSTVGLKHEKKNVSAPRNETGEVLSGNGTKAASRRRIIK